MNLEMYPGLSFFLVTNGDKVCIAQGLSLHLEWLLRLERESCWRQPARKRVARSRHRQPAATSKWQEE